MNILFIILDALRYDYYRNYMPNLNKYADSCRDYTHAMSCGPNTRKSLNMLLSYNYEWSEESKKDNLIVDLSEKGYYTQMIFSSPILYDYKELFDESIDVFKETEGIIASKLREHFHGALPWRAYRKFVIGLGYRRAKTLINIAKKHLVDTPTNCFTWLHFMDPHVPYSPPNLEDYTTWKEAERVNNLLRKSRYHTNGICEKDQELLRRLYRGECEYLDGHLKSFLDWVMADLIIITADHGDLLGEYDRFSHPGKGLYVPELLHVPLIIKDGKTGKVDEWFSHYNLRKMLNRVTEQA